MLLFSLPICEMAGTKTSSVASLSKLRINTTYLVSGVHEIKESTCASSGRYV